MRLSKRGEYALRALIDLGIAEELGRPLVRVSELVDKEHLPVTFLEQILFQLRQNGIVDAKRGRSGGYFLAKPMKEIRFGDIVRLIDGPLAPIPCVSQTAYEACTCPDESHCGLRMLMMDVRNAISRILDQYTLDDVVQVTLRKIRRDGVAIPFLEGFMEFAVPEITPALVEAAPASPAKREPGAKRRVRRRASKG